VLGRSRTPYLRCGSLAVFKLIQKRRESRCVLAQSYELSTRTSSCATMLLEIAASRVARRSLQCLSDAKAAATPICRRLRAPLTSTATTTAPFFNVAKSLKTLQQRWLASCPLCGHAPLDLLLESLDTHEHSRPLGFYGIMVPALARIESKPTTLYPPNGRRMSL
jgi:hypothetical protein